MQFGKRGTPSALAGVSKADLRELHRLPNPPQFVKSIISAMCLLLGYPVATALDWRKQRAILGFVLRGGVQLPFMISPQALTQVKREIRDVNSLEVAYCTSMAAVNLFMWTKKRLLYLDPNLR